MASHRFRFFSIGLGVGASLGLLLTSRPGSGLGVGSGDLADGPLSGKAGGFGDGDAESAERASTPVRRQPDDLEGARDSGMRAYRDALGQRW